MMDLNIQMAFPNMNYYYMLPGVLYIYYPLPLYSNVFHIYDNINQYNNVNTLSIIQADANNEEIEVKQEVSMNDGHKKSGDEKDDARPKVKKKKKNLSKVNKIIFKKRVANKKTVFEENSDVISYILKINNAKTKEDIISKNEEIKNYFFEYEEGIKRALKDKHLLFMLKNFSNNFTFKNYYINKHLLSRKRMKNALKKAKTDNKSKDISQYTFNKVWSVDMNSQRDVENYIKDFEKYSEYKLNEEVILEFLKINDYEIKNALSLVKSNDEKFIKYVKLRYIQ